MKFITLPHHTEEFFVVTGKYAYQSWFTPWNLPVIDTKSTTSLLINPTGKCIAWMPDIESILFLTQ